MWYCAPPVGAMPKKSSKSRSKRTTLHQKYKVLKKVKEHHRKKAKELKKKGGRVKAPKDPGIPNAWPFKEQLVKELQFERERAEAAKAARKEAAKERRVRAPPRRPLARVRLCVCCAAPPRGGARRVKVAQAADEVQPAAALQCAPLSLTRRLAVPPAGGEAQGWRGGGGDGGG